MLFVRRFSSRDLWNPGVTWQSHLLGGLTRKGSTTDVHAPFFFREAPFRLVLYMGIQKDIIGSISPYTMRQVHVAIVTKTSQVSGHAPGNPCAVESPPWEERGRACGARGVKALGPRESFSELVRTLFRVQPPTEMPSDPICMAILGLGQIMVKFEAYHCFVFGNCLNPRALLRTPSL